MVADPCHGSSKELNSATTNGSSTDSANTPTVPINSASPFRKGTGELHEFQPSGFCRTNSSFLIEDILFHKPKVNPAFMFYHLMENSTNILRQWRNLKLQ